MNTYPDLKIVSKAIDDFICNELEENDLEGQINQYGLPSDQFEKLFQSQTRMTPSEFIRYKKMRHAKDFEMDEFSELNDAYKAGMSKKQRIHSQFVNANFTSREMAKPKNIEIYYDVHPSNIGDLFLASTDKGLCYLGFSMINKRDAAYHKMENHWRGAKFIQSFDKTKDYADLLQEILSSRDCDTKLPIDLHGTDFQLSVWQALLNIPQGTTVNYQAVARAIGKPKASRAVGSAVGANPVSWVVPCHRVIQASGIVENYGSGTDRKCAILGFESSKIFY